MSHKKVELKDVCESERYDLHSVQWTFAPETFGKRWKGGRLPVVSLQPDFLERLASRNPCILCQKHEGTCTTYYLGVPWDGKSDSRAAKKGTKKLVIRDFAKILE
jgi:hypothetical protein